jgi:hypothetical protein
MTLLLAAFGGLTVHLLNLVELQNVPKDRRPDFKDWLYWLPFGVSPALAAVVAFAYVNSGTPLSPILAINVGASTPLLLRSFTNANPFRRQVDPGAGA